MYHAEEQPGKYGVCGTASRWCRGTRAVRRGGKVEANKAAMSIADKKAEPTLAFDTFRHSVVLQLFA